MTTNSERSGMTAPLVFLDTETTGLDLSDEIWEIGAIRRDPDGSESTLHLFVDHDPAKCANLPERFLADHSARYPGECGKGRQPDVAVASPWVMANELQRFATRREPDDPQPHIFGAVPSFDTQRLEALFSRVGLVWDWHYHLNDVENWACGHLFTIGRMVIETGTTEADRDRGRELCEVTLPPVDSNELSRALGVDPDDFSRHTALGDAEWGRAMWDEVTRVDIW